MNSLWKDLYDHFKDRRYGALFLIVLCAGAGLAVLGVKIHQDWDDQYLAYVLPGSGLFAGMVGWSAVRRARACRPGQWKAEPLSGDDLRKARSKLIHPRTGKII